MMFSKTNHLENISRGMKENLKNGWGKQVQRSQVPGPDWKATWVTWPMYRFRTDGRSSHCSLDHFPWVSLSLRSPAGAMFWVAYQVWKKERSASPKYLYCLKCITIVDLNLEPFAILLQLATGPVERRSLGVLVGEVVWSLHHCATAFAEANSFRNQKTTPHTMSKYDHHVRWELNTKCKLVIIIYPGPTSKQPWLRDLKEARI